MNIERLSQLHGKILIILVKYKIRSECEKIRKCRLCSKHDDNIDFKNL